MPKTVLEEYNRKVETGVWGLDDILETLHTSLECILEYGPWQLIS